jgi:hypothetical protein
MNGYDCLLFLHVAVLPDAVSDAVRCGAMLCDAMRAVAVYFIAIVVLLDNAVLAHGATRAGSGAAGAVVAVAAGGGPLGGVYRWSGSTLFGPVYGGTYSGSLYAGGAPYIPPIWYAWP